MNDNFLSVAASEIDVKLITRLTILETRQSNGRLSKPREMPGAFETA